MHLKALNDSLTKIENIQESTTDLILVAILVTCCISPIWGWGLSVISYLICIQTRQCLFCDSNAYLSLCLISVLMGPSSISM